MGMRIDLLKQNGEFVTSIEMEPHSTVWEL